MIHDYFIEYEKSNALNMPPPGQYELGQSMANLHLNNDWVDARPDPNQTAHPESE